MVNSPVGAAASILRPVGGCTATRLLGTGTPASSTTTPRTLAVRSSWPTREASPTNAVTKLTAAAMKNGVSRRLEARHLLIKHLTPTRVHYLSRVQAQLRFGKELIVAMCGVDRPEQPC